MLEVGKLKFTNESDEEIYSAPIFGNWKIWDDFSVTLKITERW